MRFMMALLTGALVGVCVMFGVVLPKMGASLDRIATAQERCHDQK